MQVATKFRQNISQKLAQLTQRWHGLTVRDRWALIILAIFLFLMVGVYGGYQLHHSAGKQRLAYDEAVSDYFWLRSQAGNIASGADDGENSDGQTLESKVLSQLSQSGIANAQVAMVGDSVQLSFVNNSQAVVGQALSKLKEQGWRFSRLLIQQDEGSKQIQVQATVSQI